jgi:hypothetical protein
LHDRRDGFDSHQVHCLTYASGLRKVAEYGLPGRFAKPRDLRVMWVRIPCLPLLVISFGRFLFFFEILQLQVQCIAGDLNLANRNRQRCGHQ